MQEQNFEKQVHKLMNDLEISPSPPVWDKVEEQIRRKKDKRRFVFLLLPLILFSTGFLWWMISSENTIDTSIPSGKTTTTFSKDNTGETGKAKEEKKIEITSSTLGDQAIKKAPLITSKKSNLTGNSIANKNQVIKNKNQQNIILVKKNISETGDKQIIASETELEKSKTSNIINQLQAFKDIDTVKAETAIISETKNEQKAQDSSIKTNEAIETEVSIEEEILEKQVILANSTKWKIVPYIAGGFSNISRGLFEPVASADFAGSPGNTSGFGSFPPSAPEKGTYFTAGFRMAKKLTDRVEISTGLQYSFFSTRTKIGTRVINDTTISYSNAQVRLLNYYQSGNTDNYINSYHFISLPATIEYQLLKNIPLSLQAGFSLNRLVSTNALLYNRNSNIQFENDNAWNKTQLHTFYGLNFHFLKNKPFSFKAGPFLQYSLTRLEHDVSRKQFLSVAGFQTQFYFQNKK